MPKERQKIDFFKQNLEEYIKIANENNDDYSFRMSNGLQAGNQNTIFFLSDNFITFKYYTDATTYKLRAFAYGLSGKNKKLTISKCIPSSRNIAAQTIGLTIDAHSTMVKKYKIISSEPERGYYKNIKLISNKFQYLFDSLKSGR